MVDSDDRDALSALLHLEVESSGDLLFSSYDNFTIIVLGEALDLDFLADLSELGIVSFQ